ncbi:MAG TPA: hypothetical protein VMJ35_16635 [Dongiaceae bacterium]|nr:hypothetical protein [Dongiaceae bacterium]
MMKRNWIIFAAAMLLILAGCGKSADNSSQAQPAANQPAPNAASNQPAPGTPGGAPGQAAPTSEPAPPPEPPKPFEIAEGTALTVVLSTTINSKNVTAGQEFDATVASPVSVDEEVAIPKGSPVRITVVNSKKQGAVKGEATLTIKPVAITVRGKEYPIGASSVSATEKGKGKRSAIMTGGGAAAGALIGGLAGGGKGAAIGAAVGGGGGLAASAGTGGKNAEFAAESRLTFKLTHSLTVDR